MVPIRQVASWRSYVNIAATAGRSLGGPIGGYLTDRVGWRWFVTIEHLMIASNEVLRSFLCQCPPMLIALLLVIWKLEIPPDQCTLRQSNLSKLRRIDFAGAIFLTIFIVCGLLVLDLGGQGHSYTSPYILSLFGASLVAGNCFLLVEGLWAKEPIFTLSLLLNRNVVTSYLYMGFVTGAQMAVSFSPCLEIIF